MLQPAWLLFFTVIGCGGAEPGAADAGDPDSVRLAGSCPLATRVGGFAVDVRLESSNVGGQVADGVIPLTVLEETLSVGDCRLLRRNDLFCDPPCTTGETCGHDGSCIAQPTQQDVGVVSVEGLTVPVSMSPVAPGNNYFDTTVPHPVFEAGGVIHLRSSAGNNSDLSLFGVAPEEWAVPTDPWVIDKGLPIEVMWSAPSSANVRSSIGLRLSIDQHGSSPVRVECEFVDDGAGEIDEEIVTALVEAGVSGFPNGSLVRGTTDHQLVADGCVDFSVARPLTHSVRVEGHIPCLTSEQCPDGYTCQPATQTCVESS